MDQSAAYRMARWAGGLAGVFVIVPTAVVLLRRLDGHFTAALPVSLYWLSTAVIAILSSAAVAWGLPEQPPWRGGRASLLRPLIAGAIAGVWALALSQQAGLVAGCGAAAICALTWAAWLTRRTLPNPVIAVNPGLTGNGFDWADSVEDEPEDDSHTVHEWRRVTDADEGVMCEGTYRVDFEPGQREAAVHLAFCPAFPGQPLLEAEDATGAGLEARVGVVYPHGARLSVRRTGGTDSTLSAPLSYIATWPTTARESHG
jgi:hypothetical protein